MCALRHGALQPGGIAFAFTDLWAAAGKEVHMPPRRTILVGIVLAALLSVPRVTAAASPFTSLATARLAPAAALWSSVATPFDPAYHTYSWPLIGRIINGYRASGSPYGPGHRGIDIAAPVGTDVKASAPGVVAFAGSVAGALWVSIDHPDGVRTSYGYLSSIAVAKGDLVARGQVIAASGLGHPGSQIPHLHFGARFGGAYIDPMLLLVPLDFSPLIHLGPLPATPA
jgi:murein DD-endopeptidase MepM/ murein hydrolase activator NlpD